MEGREIDEAVGLGRAAVRLGMLETKEPDLRDWGVPVLYLRSSGGALFQPVSDARAVLAATQALDRVARHQPQEPAIKVKQRFGNVGKTGRVVGTRSATLRSGSTRIEQKVRDEVEGTLTGACVDRIEGGKVSVDQEAENVTGDVTGIDTG